MGLFSSRARQATSPRAGAGAGLPESVAAGLPPKFEAVGEALAAGRGSAEACAVVGETLARDGASLDEGLEALRVTALAVTDSEPTFGDVRSLAMTWSETTLGYLHALSCEEPLTGLASLAHVRSRLSEQRRQGERGGELPLQESHALVVVHLDDRGPIDRWTRSLRLASLGEAARSVFNGSETIGRLGHSSLVVIGTRDDRLARRVSLLRTLVESISPGARVWIEGLPATDDSTAALLDELARA